MYLELALMLILAIDSYLNQGWDYNIININNKQTKYNGCTFCVIIMFVIKILS